MNEDKRRFDFHGLGHALKKAREGRGWTQAYVGELVGRTDRTIMSIENKGQHPSFNLFFKLVTLFDISVDQFFYKDGDKEDSSCRKHIDVLLDTMTEQAERRGQRDNRDAVGRLGTKTKSAGILCVTSGKTAG